MKNKTASLGPQNGKWLKRASFIVLCASELWCAQMRGSKEDTTAYYLWPHGAPFYSHEQRNTALTLAHAHTIFYK